MEIPFDELWTPDEASFHLTGTSDLEPNIRSAILADKLTAERREYNRIPRTLSMSEQVDEAVREAIYGTSAKTEPTNIHEYRIKPTDAVEWAIAAGVDIRPECLTQYHKLVTPTPTKSRPPGSAGKWPWGDYETPLLKILAEAVNQFCLTDDYPKKDGGEIVQWIRERMKQEGLPPSDTLADKIETIISPRLYSHQRQRKQR